MSMLSSMARSPQGKDLLKFMDESGIKEDWDDPKSQDVTASFTGIVFDNQDPPSMMVDGCPNNEILVHLSSPHGKCIVNLNTMLALASGYIDHQYVLADKEINQRSDASPRTPVRTNS